MPWSAAPARSPDVRSCASRATRPVPLGVCASESLVLVSNKSERRVARSVVAEYHQAELDDLVARVGEAIDRYRVGDLDAFDVDQVLFQYARAAKELWKYCNYLQVEIAAAMIREQPPHDWWERGAPRER
jgi:hypothetical protein